VTPDDCATTVALEMLKVPFPVMLVELRKTLLGGVFDGTLTVTPEGMLRVAIATVKFELKVTVVPSGDNVVYGVAVEIVVGLGYVTVAMFTKVKEATTF
jgi:hypothetical protein